MQKTFRFTQPKIVGTKYIVNKDKRTIACVLKIDKEYVIGDTITGIAKCNPSDVWNENIGKRISNINAHIKFHRWVQQNCNSELDNMIKMYAYGFGEMERRIIKCQKLIASKNSLINGK